jgi:hypothetical protein
MVVVLIGLRVGGRGLKRVRIGKLFMSSDV